MGAQMRNYSRRTFIKHSAMLTGAAAAGHLLPSPAAGLAAAGARPRGAQEGAAVRRGAEHPFFARTRNRPEVIAHRGGDGQWPGETMFAFKRAMALKVDVLEMDVYLTRDKQLVLMHDDDVTTTTDYVPRRGERARKRLRDFELAELQRLNAGHKWSPPGTKKHDYADSRDKDLRVASLEEVFKEFRGMRMNIEMKKAGRDNNPAKQLADLICQSEMKENVLVASAEDDYIGDFRTLCPDVATSASLIEMGRFNISARVRGSYRPAADAIQILDELWVLPVITRQFVEWSHCDGLDPRRAARCRRLPVHAWTINDIGEMRKMIALGVDGIITDYPGPLLALLDRLRPA
jgi:glycerophosphoryl diester phosphodiesterase